MVASSTAFVAENIVLKAVAVTLIVAGGLTVVAWVAPFDITGWGMYLCAGLLCLLGVGLIGWIFGFNMGIWYSGIGVSCRRGWGG